MDNLALTRIAYDLRRDLPGHALVEVRQAARHSFRLLFARGGATLSLEISLRPDLPWIGVPRGRPRTTHWSPEAFAVQAARELGGRVVIHVAKPPADRSLRLAFAGERGLAVELVPRAPHLVLLGEGGIVLASARRSKRDAARLGEGAVYAPRAVPTGWLDPFAADARGIDRRLAVAASEGQTPVEALTRSVASIGIEGATAIVREAASTGRTPGEVLRARIEALLEGRDGPVIEGPEPPDQALARGTLSPESFRLLPWRPQTPRPGAELFSRQSAAATVGLYYGCLEEASLLGERAAALLALVAAAIRRADAARTKARDGLDAFSDPDRFRRAGEALLAGLHEADREGGIVRVPDPYDPSGPSIAIEAPPERSLTQIADDLFKRHRRARRGREASAERIAALERRIERLLSLGGRPLRPTADWAETMEADLRALGIPVGLAGPSRAARAATRLAKPSLQGVRLVETADGLTILVGRTARDNDRLTFKIAAPDDIWLHAQGVTGAHVVIRTAGAGDTVPKATLLEAARLAAWFSDARLEPQAEVQWTRRKYVRRARGAGSGAVLLKRFQTLRVRPEPPESER